MRGEVLGEILRGWIGSSSSAEGSIGGVGLERLAADGGG